MNEKEKASQGCQEKIIFEFISKGTQGPTIDTGTNAYLIEVHFKGKKHLIKLPRDLAEAIPTFSILKIIEE